MAAVFLITAPVRRHTPTTLSPTTLPRREGYLDIHHLQAGWNKCSSHGMGRGFIGSSRVVSALRLASRRTGVIRAAVLIHKSGSSK